MKHICILSVCALMASATAALGAPPQLAVLGADGSVTAVHAAGDIARITFADGAATVTGHGGTAAVHPTGEVARIVFDSDGAYTAAAVDIPAAGIVAVTPNPVDGYFAVSGCDGSTLEVYSATGARVMRVDDYCGSQLDASALAPGIYIVKTDSFTAKLIKL